MAELGLSRIAWDRGYLKKRSIDPAKFSDLYFGEQYPWRSLLVGDQGTAEISRDHPSLARPAALYATWEYGLNPLPQLREWLEENPDPSQRHLVFITRPPTAGHRPFFQHLHELMEDNPHAEVHVHGLYGFGRMFGSGFHSLDYEPKKLARRGKVVLPIGKEVQFEDAWFYYPKWVRAIGYERTDLSVPRNRCMFNMAAARWAGLNWNAKVEFERKAFQPVAPKEFLGGETKIDKPTRRKNAKPGDMIECNSCSLQFSCSLFRAGRLCLIPGSEGAMIAKFFQTQKVEDALDGLGKIVEISAERTERAVALEKEGEEIDPEVSKLVDSLWKKGAEYVRLLQPKGPLVNINNAPTAITGPAAAELTGTTDEHQLVAAAFAKLERAGWPRAAITEEAVGRVLRDRVVPAYAPELEEADVIE